MSKQRLVDSFLDYHGIEPRVGNPTRFKAVCQEREVEFSIDETDVKVKIGNELVVIAYKEIEQMNPYLFPDVERQVATSLGSNLMSISSSDKAVRLALCVRGDVIKITRLVAFGGAGFQHDIMHYKVI
jgi:hypothetical protein